MLGKPGGSAVDDRQIFYCVQEIRSKIHVGYIPIDILHEAKTSLHRCHVQRAAEVVAAGWNPYGGVDG